MKRNPILLVIALCLSLPCLQVFAQPGTNAVLVLRSVAGEGLLLVLDNEVVNTSPHAEIRLEGMAPGSHAVSVRIMGNSTAPATLNGTVMLQANAEATYNVVNARGRYVLELGPVMPLGGNPNTAPNRGGGTQPAGNTQTATFHMDAGGWVPGGFGIGISVSETTTNGTTSTQMGIGGMNITTTTTTTGGGFQQTQTLGQPDPVFAQQYSGPMGCPAPMPPNVFEGVLGNIRAARNTAAKLAFARTEIERGCMTSAQITRVVEVQDFERDKVEMAKWAYDFVFDCQNYLMVMNAFGISNNAREVEMYVRSRPCGPGMPPPNQVVVVQPAGPPNPMPGYTGRIGCPAPTMDPGRWNSALQTIRQASFATTQKTLANNILNNNCLTVGQILEMINLFSFESDKLEVAKRAWNSCFDVDNFFSLSQAFSFESSTTALMDHTNANPRGNPNPWVGQPQQVQQVIVQPGNPGNWQQQQQVQTQPAWGGRGCGMPTMDPGRWGAALQSVRSQSFASTQKTVAMNILNNNCLTTNQIKELVQIFDFESDKLEVAKAAWRRCADQENYFMLNDVFDFESSVEDLTRFTGGN